MSDPMADGTWWHVRLRGSQRGSYNLQTPINAANPLAAIEKALTMWRLDPDRLHTVHAQPSDGKEKIDGSDQS